MPRTLTLEGVFVSQGNGNGKSIELNSEKVLYTSDLCDCIAILIKGPNQCIMIHSDSNSNAGKGATTLQHALSRLNPAFPYKIGLIGGNSETSLQEKKRLIIHFLPNSSVSFMKVGGDSAYLSGTGVMAESKRDLKAKLRVDDINISDSHHRSFRR